MDQEPVIHRLFPELTAFEAAVMDDPEVLGVLYVGSLDRRTCDRFSDLDLVIWVPEEARLGAGRLRELLGRLGEVQYICSDNEWSATARVGPAWRRTDLALLRQKDLKPGPFFVDARVIKDTDGVLARLVAESPPEVVRIILEEARRLIQGAVDSQNYFALHNARGAVWSAMGEISRGLT